MNSKVSIIVPCYNSEKTISRCLESIFSSISSCGSLYDFQIIVVNDGSTDKTLSAITDFNNIKIINHDKNLGLSSARNSGIKNTDSDYIIFIDSDIAVSQDWFSNILNAITQNDDIIGITGNLEPYSKENVSTLDKYLFGTYRGTKVINFDYPLDYRSFVFSNTLIKRSVLNNVGGFDSELKNYGGEDTELAIRIHKEYPKGMRKLTTINGYHITHKTIENHLDQMFEYGKHNFHSIVKKHPEYKNDLGYRWVSSFWSNLLFNTLTVWFCRLLLKFFKSPLLIKFLVINSFIRGARN